MNKKYHEGVSVHLISNCIFYEFYFYLAKFFVILNFFSDSCTWWQFWPWVHFDIEKGNFIRLNSWTGFFNNLEALKQSKIWIFSCFKQVFYGLAGYITEKVFLHNLLKIWRRKKSEFQKKKNLGHKFPCSTTEDLL